MNSAEPAQNKPMYKSPRKSVAAINALQVQLFVIHWPLQ
jgi:hypothetical protein